MRNEAQLAGVVAHESAHFLRKHQLRQWRDVRRKTDIFAFLAMGTGLASGATGVYAGDLVQLAQLGTILSLLRYNRVLEAEADAMSVRLLADAGYDPVEASDVWRQLIGELDLSAKYRRKKRDRHFTIFETHPAPEARMADLRASALEMKVPGRTYDSYRARYLARDGHDPADPARRSGQAERSRRQPYVIDTWPRTAENACFASRRARSGGCATASRKDDEIRALKAIRRRFLSRRSAECWRWHGIMLLKQGRTVEARSAFARYLQLAPNAPDAPLVRQMMAG